MSDNDLRALPGSRLEACGVATVAVYFPGYHESVDNNNFWGKGWTEWEHLRNRSKDEWTGKQLRQPLGYNYYNIWDQGAATMRRQAAQAKKAGFKAFMIYHYWFAHGRTSLSRPVEDAVFQDDQTRSGLGLPFYFSWANEAWSRRWSGVDEAGQTLISQAYGTEAEWLAHFHWLARFFKLDEYVKIGGRPVLAIYDMPGILSGRALSLEYTVPTECTAQFAPERQQCGAKTPFGCAGAALYLRWYPDLLNMGIKPESAYEYHQRFGAKSDRSWPRADPCLNASREIDPTILPRMLSLWHAEAKLMGFPGLYIAGTVGSSIDRVNLVRKSAGNLDAVLQFMPMSLLVKDGVGPNHESITLMQNECRRAEGLHRKMRDMPKCALEAGCPGAAWHKVVPPSCDCLLRKVAHQEQRDLPNLPRGIDVFRGAFATWSNFPRHATQARPMQGIAFCRQPSPSAYEALLQVQLRRSVADLGGGARCVHVSRNVSARATLEGAWRRLVVVNAWNEWGEQSVLEPTVQDGHALLEAHARALKAVEKAINGVRPRRAAVARAWADA